MRRLIRILVGACALGAAPAALALPVVSVDAPVTVAVGSSFSVDIAISDVSNLNGFEFDVLFDPNVLAAISVSDGGFLLAPVFEVQNDVGLIKVEFAEVTLGPSGASGSGVLATIAFDTLLPGVSALDLENVLLAAPFGVLIPADVLDGSVAVAPPASAIPEPSAALLYALGFGCVGFRLRQASDPAATRGRAWAGDVTRNSPRRPRAGGLDG